MTLEVTREERDILLRLIDRELGDLGSEIRRTQTSNYRDDLKVYKKQLRVLADRVKATPNG
jgi:hypothetical protein